VFWVEGGREREEREKEREIFLLVYVADYSVLLLSAFWYFHFISSGIPLLLLIFFSLLSSVPVLL